MEVLIQSISLASIPNFMKNKNSDRIAGGKPAQSMIPWQVHVSMR